MLSPQNKVMKNNFLLRQKLKRHHMPLDASRRAGSGGGFGIPIGRPVAWEINFPVAVQRAPIQL